MLKSVIVLTNSIDESEKIKSLASFNESTFDLRYMSALELAEYLLQLSGISYEQAFIKNDELAALIYKQIKAITYFELFTFNDVLGLVDTLEDLRYQIIDNEAKTIFSQLPMDKFVAKNKALKNAYEIIIKALEDNNYIDEIGIVRLALKEIKTQSNIEFIRYEKSHLRPLELALLNKATGKEVPETKINEEAKPLAIERYTKAFGQTNEIEDILNYIYEKKIPFDQCLIASAEEANYANILSNYRDLLKAPITLGVGKLISSTNPGKVFALLDDWKNSNYRYEFLLKLVNSESFNQEQLKEDLNLPEDLSSLNADLDKRNQISLDAITEIVGRLKVNFEDKENNLKKYEDYEKLVKKYLDDKYNIENTKSRIKTLGHVKKFIEIINLGLYNFIERYSISKDKVDSSALSKILKMIYFEDNFGVPYDDGRDILFNQKISREKPQPGTLYFTSISRAASCLRKYLFITGLSSNNFPGSSKENALLLDIDYLPFGVKDASNREIINNKESYEALLEEAKKYNVEIHLSWASYNSETLKAQNSSSVVFETYKEENGQDKTLGDFNKEFSNTKYRYIEYFDSQLLPISDLGKVLQKNKTNAVNKVEEKEEAEISVESLKGKAFSASALGDFAKCEYLFYLKYVLGIKQPEDIDIFEVIPANEYGTMAHDLLEHLNKSKTSLDEFKEQAANRFNEYLIFNPSDNPALVEKSRKDFVKMMQNAYEMEENSKTALSEHDEYCTHKPTGLRIHGFPDSVIKNTDGTYRIVDYKTGRSMKHFVDDIPSMIQCTVYSYVIENKCHLNVTSFEYRYLRNKAHVYSNDKGYTMATHYSNLDSVLEKLKVAIETGHFDDADASICKDCYHKDVCTKRK